MSALPNDHQSLCKGSTATQRVPRGTPILIGAGWRSQTIGEIFKGTDGACADPDTRIFPATGAYSQAPPSSLIQLTFTSQRSLLCYFLGLQESNVSLLPQKRTPAILR